MTEFVKGTHDRKLDIRISHNREMEVLVGLKGLFEDYHSTEDARRLAFDNPELTVWMMVKTRNSKGTAITSRLGGFHGKMISTSNFGWCLHPHFELVQNNTLRKLTNNVAEYMRGCRASPMATYVNSKCFTYQGEQPRPREYHYFKGGEGLETSTRNKVLTRLGFVGSQSPVLTRADLPKISAALRLSGISDSGWKTRDEADEYFESAIDILEPIWGKRVSGARVQVWLALAARLGDDAFFRCGRCNPEPVHGMDTNQLAAIRSTTFWYGCGDCREFPL